nr:hypothetical protein [Inquilinus limosus]
MVTSRRSGIEAQAAADQGQRRLRAGPPQRRADPGQQLLSEERLGQVVVRPGVEAADFLVQPVQRRQHDHRRAGLQPPHHRQQRQPLGTAQPAVEQDQPVPRRGQGQLRLGVGGRAVDQEAALGEAAGDQPRHVRLVLDQQDPCHSSPPVAGGARPGG